MISGYEMVAKQKLFFLLWSEKLKNYMQSSEHKI